MKTDDKVPDQLRGALRTALNLALWIVVVLVIIYMSSGIYSVANNEVAVHQRFGKIIDSYVRPGIHWGFPWPFDKINKVAITKNLNVEIDDFSQNFLLNADGRVTFATLTGLGTYVITGDNNLLNVKLSIKYKVVDPVAYLFNLGETIDKAETAARRFLIEMACISIIHCFAGMDVDDALKNRNYIVNYVRGDLQKRLDFIKSGLSVHFIELKALEPPNAVKEYFDDVTNAKIDMKQEIDSAKSYEFEEIPAAEGRASRLIAEAEGYCVEVVEKAKGDGHRFNELLKEYKNNFALTKYRLYMEAIQEVLGTAGKYYIVDTAQNGKPANLKLFSK